uniref:Serine-threonine kinase receptor-associated protein n=1 Tax=Piliocolobus tephrosceles TaxID=591936 RepID=A0A8C9HBB8_9PRIM
YFYFLFLFLFFIFYFYFLFLFFIFIFIFYFYFLFFIFLGLYECTGAVYNSDVTYDSKNVCCSSAAHKVYIFDVNTGTVLKEFDESGPVRYVEFNKDPLNQNKLVVSIDKFAQGCNRTIKVYDWSDKTVIWEKEHESRCIQVSWCFFDKIIVSAHENGEIIVWNAEDGSEIKCFTAHTKEVTSLSFDKNRMIMLSSSSDGTAALRDTMNFDIINEYKTDRPLNTCDISPLFKNESTPKNHIILAGGQAAEYVTTTTSGEGKFQTLLYDIVHANELGSIKGHFGTVHSIKFLPHGDGFVSGGEDGFARIYHFDKDYFIGNYD